MIKATKITVNRKDFRVIVGDVFSANDDFRAMLSIECDNKDVDLLQKTEERIINGREAEVVVGDNFNSAVVTCYVLGQLIEVPIEGGEVTEWNGSSAVVYVYNDTV